eukprot:4721258-Alexandrium_andersonii.AAC.1
MPPSPESQLACCPSGESVHIERLPNEYNFDGLGACSGSLLPLTCQRCQHHEPKRFAAQA